MFVFKVSTSSRLQFFSLFCPGVWPPGGAKLQRLPGICILKWIFLWNIKNKSLLLGSKSLHSH